ncbi:hypothetical protein Ahy_A02g006537 [Arachis hypogaea]|uniref:Retrotransposon Copia-like N-terminal domain-containing protein n=1 Tax=Arachis hypogaea TaxID=3818 RepID=A0A445EA37_ARAHY|nr:hypothetical protein Ahy_A02g006537 [Arachis hypogaea]
MLTIQTYHSWSCSVWLVLKSKNKLRFIDGFLPKPKRSDSSFEAWDRCNTTSYGVSYFTKLKVLWEELDEFQPLPTCDCNDIPEHGIFTTVSLLQQERQLNHSNSGEGKSLVNAIANMDSLSHFKQADDALKNISEPQLEDSANIDNLFLKEQKQALLELV